MMKQYVYLSAQNGNRPDLITQLNVYREKGELVKNVVPMPGDKQVMVEIHAGSKEEMQDYIAQKIRPLKDMEIDRIFNGI